MRRLFFFLSVLWAAAFCPPAAAMPYTFSRIDASDGLSDNQVQHILQLPDGRMVFTTLGNINLYDGMQFRYIHRNDSDAYTLDSYTGAYHVYVGANDLLWIKDYKRLRCLDLRRERYRTHPEQIFRETGTSEHVTDLFVDSEQGLWLVTARGLWEAGLKRYLPLPADAGPLQDVEVAGDRLYLFFSNGEVYCHSRRNGQLLYSEAAYPADERALYANTSLVVKGPDGNFYQLRVGRRGGFFAFNTQTRQWRKLIDTREPLHTLIVPTARTAYISSLNGIYEIDLPSGRTSFRSTLRTAEGQCIVTDINTIFQDRQLGIWLGTRDQGVLYAHSQRFRFVSAPDLGNLLPQADAVLLPQPAPRTVFDGQAYNDVHTDSRGWTWAGTADGLRLFVPGETGFRTLYTEDGLTNNFVHAITEDHNGDLWVSTSCGLSRIRTSGHPDTLRFANFRQEDGTLRGEYRNRDVRHTRDGHLLMGGVEGWTLFHPDSVEIPRQTFHPLLIGLSLHGQAVSIARDTADAGALLPYALPYVSYYEFSHDQNNIAFDFSALNYACPTHTHYRYRLMHEADSAWYTAHWRPAGGAVDSHGCLHLSFALLPPGDYRLQVMASTHHDDRNGPLAEVAFRIRAPWWRTPYAYTAYVLILLSLAAAGLQLYIRQSRQRILRRHKEDILLLRMQHLIERCNRYERQYDSAPAGLGTKPEKEPPINAADREFLNKAVALVEAHINTPGYSVEQLSKDLCMDRSGLYKKLTTLLDKSPSLFIRSIRLKKAAALLREGRLNVSEIAEEVGFSSASYMSKCFQEEFGCKPSEYALQAKEST